MTVGQRNLDVLHAYTAGMTAMEERAVCDWMLGALAVVVDPAVWDSVMVGLPRQV